MTSIDPGGAQPAPPRRIDTIVVHHTAHPGLPETDARAAVAALRALHRERGWEDIGYHLVIDAHGGVARGRDPAIPGAHVRGQNATSLGIAVLGDFGDDPPTPRALDALATSIAALAAVHGVETDRIVGHRDLDPSTACPGDRLAALLPELRLRARRAAR